VGFQIFKILCTGYGAPVGGAAAGAGTEGKGPAGTLQFETLNPMYI
jgi:hypothetical protein